MLGLSSSLVKGGASLLTFVKDNLKLYLDFKKSRSDTLAFPSDGSTSFDASGDYIKVPHNDSLNLGTSDFTISFWVKSPSTTSNNMSIVDKYHSNVGFTIVWHTSNKLRLYIKDGTDDYYSYANQTLSFGVWYHFAVVFNATTNKATYYIDGVNVAKSSEDDGNIDSISNTGELTIGASASNGYSFKGSLANLAMWSRVLSPEEVQSVMNKSYSQLVSVEKTSLVSWWALDGTEYSSELWDADASTFDSGTHSWIKYHVANGLENDSGALKISRPSSGGDHRGAYVWFKDASDLSKDLIVGATYRITFDAKVNSGTSVNVTVHANGTPSATVTETSFTSKSIDFVASSVNTNYLDTMDLNANEIIWLDNLSLKVIQNPDSKGSNNGTVVGATTTTSVYGGNAPILPRAIDIAESFAEQIGNGSALLNTVNINGTDRIPIEKTLVLGTNDFTITAWANSIGGDSGYQGVVSIGTATDNQSTYMGIIASNNWGFGLFGLNHDSGISVASTVNEWNHLAMAREGSNLKFYFNGILVATGSAGSLSMTDGGTHIGSIGDNNTYNFNGNIASVGIWQGTLSQSQVQSVMESTSYSKIPASVKSTLGNDVKNYHSVDNVNNSFVNNIVTFTTNGYVFFSGVAPASTLFKFEYTILTNTASGLRLAGGSSAFGSPSLDDSVGTHSLYLVSSSNVNANFLSINSAGFRGTITDISVKEVTNDIVAYYPLDAGENSNMSKDYTVADSLMTFGDNLLADGDAGSDGWTNDTGGTNPPAVNEKSSEYAKEGTFSRKFVADGGTDAVNTPTFTTETGATYQVSFWIRPNSTSQNFYIYQGDGSGTNTFIAEATSTTWLRSYTANQWNKLVGYFTESGGGSNAYLQFESPSSSDVTYYIDEVKVKKVLSGNYGRLL